MSRPSDIERWYPDRGSFQSHAEWNAHRHTLDMLYDLRDRVEKAQRVGPSGKPTSAPSLQSGVNSQISGYNVSGSPTGAAQVPTYNAQTGQIEWQNTPGPYASDAAAAAAGVPINGLYYRAGGTVYIRLT